MTVSSTNRKAGPYYGNGVTAAFPFSFKVFAASDLLVVKTNLTTGVDTVLATTDYSVSLTADTTGGYSGGTVTLTAGALASTYTLTITSSILYTQNTDLTNNGGFYPKVINSALDRLTILCQQLLEQVSRSLKLSISTPANVKPTLPAPVKNNMIAWNENADGLQNLDPQALATIVAFGTSKADKFSGDGTTTQFALSNNPGALNNLDVSIGGVTQRPGIDYNWSAGTVITFTTAPATGTNNILVRYMQGLPQGYTTGDLVQVNDGAGGSVFTTAQGFISRLMSSSGAALLGFIQAGVGAVFRSTQDELREWVKVTQFGASPSASAATNYAAFVATTNYAAANGLGVLIPAGSYTLDNNWIISTGGMRVRAEGKVILNFTNSGACVTVDGGASGTYIFDVHFGTENNPIWINGNINTTTALLWRAAHHGSAAIKAWNCVIGHRTQFAVCNNFWITVSNSEAVSNVLVPTAGISCERRGVGEDTAANVWWAPVIEGILTSTGHGIYLGNTNRNRFIGGTSEGNVIGVYATSSAVGDTIQGLYCEVNSGAAHFDISGSLIQITDCFSATAAPAPTDWVRFRVGATDCRVIGGNHPSIRIDTGAVRTQVIANAHSNSTTVIDNGTDTTVIQGGSAGKLPFGAYIGGGAAPLSYYSEGTFTAAMTCGTSGTITLNSSFQTLGWVKVGRLVTVTGLLIVSGVSSPTGLCMIGNLPFLPDNASSSRAAVTVRAASLAAGAATSVQGRIISADNKIYLEYFAAGAATNLSPQVQAGSEFYITATYIAAS